MGDGTDGTVILGPQGTLGHQLERLLPGTVLWDREEVDVTDFARLEAKLRNGIPRHPIPSYGHFLSRHIRIYGMWFFTPHALLHVVSFGLLGFLASLISERWPVRTCAIAERCSAGLRDRMGPIPVPSGQPV